ncbi:hypothetical protein GLE_1347 [Lysobacter enzymogenes]|uniref:Uncharacterized protein n=1 Tax=Lysobacter enzymogenes TaxID=69 RepID=A0A0S2DE00_LYSEN|nr:hypothetical protein GLE_1347 [Lysobacter enzymogenes]
MDRRETGDFNGCGGQGFCGGRLGASARPCPGAFTVIPAKAGTHFDLASGLPAEPAGYRRAKRKSKWVPAFAGMTGLEKTAPPVRRCANLPTVPLPARRPTRRNALN